jgi:hypothetical protein
VPPNGDVLNYEKNIEIIQPLIQELQHFLCFQFQSVVLTKCVAAILDFEVVTYFSIVSCYTSWVTHIPNLNILGHIFLELLHKHVVLKCVKPSWILTWWPTFQQRHTPRGQPIYQIWIFSVAYFFSYRTRFVLTKCVAAILGFRHGDLLFNSDVLHLEGNPLSVAYSLRTRRSEQTWTQREKTSKTMPPPHLGPGP